MGGEEGRRGGEDRTTTIGREVERWRRKRGEEKRRIVQEEGEVRRKDEREER